MKATMTPPITRNVELTMTETEAILLKLFIGKMEPYKVKEATKCTHRQAHDIVNGIYNALGEVLQ